MRASSICAGYGCVKTLSTLHLDVVRRSSRTTHRVGHTSLKLIGTRDFAHQSFDGWVAKGLKALVPPSRCWHRGARSLASSPPSMLIDGSLAVLASIRGRACARPTFVARIILGEAVEWCNKFMLRVFLKVYEYLAPRLCEGGLSLRGVDCEQLPC